MKAYGKEPSLREQFTNLVIDGKRILNQSLRRNVGLGSNKHDIEGESLLILWTSSSLSGSKTLKGRGAIVGASVEEPKLGNISQIFLIL